MVSAMGLLFFRSVDWLSGASSSMAIPQGIVVGSVHSVCNLTLETTGRFCLRVYHFVTFRSFGLCIGTISGILSHFWRFHSEFTLFWIIKTGLWPSLSLKSWEKEETKHNALKMSPWLVATLPFTNTWYFYEMINSCWNKNHFLFVTFWR